jgi:arginine utilization regulatory protein
MFDSFPLGVIITDASGIVVYYNQAHSDADGLSQEEILGRRWIEALVPLNGPNIMYVSQRMAKPVLGYIYSYKTFKGRVVNAAYWVYPIMQGDEVTGSICFTQFLKAAGRGEAGLWSSPPLEWPGYIILSDPIQHIVGKNQAFLRAVDVVKDNAANSFPVLISGEPGSGRELLAKLAHQSSDRRSNPYLSVNCASIPSNLLEGLLFGTTKKSFFGAIDRPGMLTEALGGTLFLDELDSMAPGLQEKLLKALDEKKAARIGSDRMDNLNFKLVASIGTDAHSAVESGRLTRDLFAKVAVVLVDIPPLRERLEDLPMLSSYFIRKYNSSLEKKAAKIDKLLWELFKRYHWPGNTSELDSVLYKAVQRLPLNETVIALKHLPEDFVKALAQMEARLPALEPRPHDQANAASELSIYPYDDDLYATYLTRLQAEERRLKSLLTETAGNVAEAARKMGISRQLLNHRLRKYGINPNTYR